MYKKVLFIFLAVVSLAAAYFFVYERRVRVMQKRTIIILNGTSSAGKTSIAKQLQKLFNEPYLYAGLDHFAIMLPEHYVGTKLWCSMSFGDN